MPSFIEYEIFDNILYYRLNNFIYTYINYITNDDVYDVTNMLSSNNKKKILNIYIEIEHDHDY